MLDRKAKLILPVLILVMLGGALWRVAHAAHWSLAPFVIPVSMIIVAGAFALQERWVVASADALAAWKKWNSFFLIGCAAILTVFQMLPVFRRLGIPLPSSELLFRLLVAGYGLVVVLTGNREPKLPSLERRWPSVMSLGKAGQIAMFRIAGWLLVAFGLITIVSALLLPLRLIAPMMGSMALAMLAAVLVKRRQLRLQN
jgi:hypothetical protein